MLRILTFLTFTALASAEAKIIRYYDLEKLKKSPDAKLVIEDYDNVPSKLEADELELNDVYVSVSIYGKVTDDDFTPTHPDDAPISSELVYSQNFLMSNTVTTDDSLKFYAPHFSLTASAIGGILETPVTVPLNLNTCIISPENINAICYGSENDFNYKIYVFKKISQEGLNRLNNKMSARSFILSRHSGNSELNESLEAVYIFDKNTKFKNRKSVTLSRYQGTANFKQEIQHYKTVKKQSARGNYNEYWFTDGTYHYKFENAYENGQRTSCVTEGRVDVCQVISEGRFVQVPQKGFVYGGELNFHGSWTLRIVNQ